MMTETGRLVHAGLQPDHLLQQQQQQQQQQQPQQQQEAATVGSPITPSITASSEETAPSSFDCLMEKVSQLTRALDTGAQRSLELPYVGPRTCLQFLECFCEIFSRKSSETATERKNLTEALETLRSTREEAEVTRETLSQLRQKHETASKLSRELLTGLTAKACQLERLRATLGEQREPMTTPLGSYSSTTMCQYWDNCLIILSSILNILLTYPTVTHCYDPF